VKKDREELLSNQELLEKFAREKYLMKKKTEDIYLVVEEK
jgi:cell division protein FtsB